jgi:hypothetical protein
VLIHNQRNQGGEKRHEHTNPAATMPGPKAHRKKVKDGEAGIGGANQSLSPTATTAQVLIANAHGRRNFRGQKSST